MKLSKIAIIGTGKLGTRLAEQLIIENVCDELYLWNRTYQKLEGVYQSLLIWNYIISSNVKISVLDKKELSNIDLIVICIKEDYDPRELFMTKPPPKWLPQNLRYVGLIRDITLIKQECQRLYNYSGKVAVITNPVDVMTSLVTRWLPRAKVYGLGLSIDAARFSYFLNKKMSPIFKPDDFIFAGEHGDELIGLPTIWKQKLKRKNISDKVIKLVSSEAKEVGFEIVKNLGYTLQDCAAVFSKDVQWLLGQNKKNIYSFSYWNELCSIGIPLMYSSQKNEIIRYSSLAEFEKDKISSAEINLFQIIQKLDASQYL